MVRMKRTTTGVTSLPTELLMEVVSYLFPVDILRLARLARFLRQIFMSKQSAFVWRTARMNLPIPLPDCPSHSLSEPQYAALVFDRVCQSCGNRSFSTATYTIRLRLCRKCYSKDIKEGRVILASIAPCFPDKYPALYAMLPMANPPEALLHPRETFDPNVVSWNNICSAGCRFARHLFHRQSFVQMYKHYRTYKEGSDSQLDFIRKHFVRSCELLKFAGEMYDWHMLDSRRLQKINSDREDAWEDDVKLNLMDLGYTPSDFDILGTIDIELVCEWNKLIRQSRQLTERIWMNIRPRLESIVLANRENLIQHRICQRRIKLDYLLCERYEVYYEALGISDIYAPFLFPTLLEDLSSKSIKQFIEDNVENDGLVNMVTLDDAAWEDVLNRGLRTELDGARSAMEEALNKVFRAGVHAHYFRDVGIRPAVPSREAWIANELELPGCTIPPSLFAYNHAAAFYSDTRHLPRIYASIFAEVTHTPRYDPRLRTDEVRKSDASLWCIVTGLVESQWVCHPEVFKIAMALLKSLGRERATMYELLERRNSFICMCCDDAKRRKVDWVALVRHFCDRLCGTGSDDTMEHDSHDVLRDRVLATESSRR